MENTDIVMYFMNRSMDITHSGLIIMLFSLFDTWILKGASINPCIYAKNFNKTLTELYDMLSPLRTLGLIMTLLIFIVTALTSGMLGGLAKRKDEFLQLVGRAILSVLLVLYGICIFWGPPKNVLSSGKMEFRQYEEDEIYVGGLFGIFDKFYHDIKAELMLEETDDLAMKITANVVDMSSEIVEVEESEMTNLQDSVSQITQVAGAALAAVILPIKLIVGIICIVLIIINVIKLLLDIIKRYLLINTFTLFFPVVGSTYTTSNTSPILSAYIRLIVGQLILHIISEFIIFGFVMLLVNITSSGIYGMFLIISWLQIGLKLDNHIQALGVNAPAMTMNVLDEIQSSAMKFMMLDRAGGNMGRALGNTMLNKAAASGNLGLAKAGLILQGKNASSSSALDAMTSTQKNSGIRTAATEQGIYESYSRGNYATAANAINGYYSSSEKDAACRSLMSAVYGDSLSTLPLGTNGMNAFHDLTPMDNGNIKGLMDVYDSENNCVGTTAFTVGPEINPKSSTSLGQIEGNSNRNSYVEFNSVNTLDPGDKMEWNSKNGDYPCAAELMTGSLDTSGMTVMQKSEFRQNCNAVETSQNGDVIYKGMDNKTMAVKTKNNAYYYRGQTTDNQALKDNLNLEKQLGYQSISYIKTQDDGSRLIEGQKLNPATNKYERSTSIMFNACEHPEYRRKGILVEGGYQNGTWLVVDKNELIRNNEKTWKRK